MHLTSITLVLQVGVGLRSKDSIPGKLTVTETTMQNTNRLDNVICLTNMSTNVIASNQRSGNPYADLRNVNSSLLNPKSNCNIGTWNVQTIVRWHCVEAQCENTKRRLLLFSYGNIHRHLQICYILYEHTLIINIWII